MADIYGEGSNSKKQWQKLKGAPLSEKIKYIATYYGIPIIAGIAIIVFAVSMTRSIIYNSIPKIIALECYSGYGADNAEDNLMQAMSEKLGVDPSKYHIEVAFSGASTTDVQQAYTLSQKIIARIAAGDLDACIGRPELLGAYMNPESIADGAFYDLRKLLSADLVSRLEADGRLVYYEIDGENIPYAIDVDGSHLEELIGVFNSGDILAFVVSSKNVDGQKALAELICAD
ncbi:MAG: hypothetical protein IKR59_03465 [Lachnospiraceae bacterium]|nr:hypothetical protein [Lachnospiraceae bacterium]